MQIWIDIIFHTYLMEENKRFSEIGILSYLKGKEVSWIVDKFKDEAGKMDNRRRHQIRQKILSSDNLSSTLSITGDLKIVLNHTPYIYQDQLSAVCLETCRNYHQFHIRYVAEIIAQTGQFECSQCKLAVQSTSQIILNAFVASYFEKIKNYQGSTLIFKKEPIGSIFQLDKERQAMQTQERTVVASKENLGVYYIIQLKVLQIDTKDQRIRDINTEKVAEEIEFISTAQKSKTFEERQLLNANNHFLINLICFKSSVRIRNPLIHRLCKPQNHKNRLVLYSYEHVYSTVFKKKKRPVRCIFPHCSNSFDEKNFYQNAIVIENIHRLIYEEYKECVYGDYFSGMYQKNWHYNYAENMLLKNEKNRPLIKRYLNQIRSNVQELLITASLNTSTKRRIYKDIFASVQENKELDQSIKLSPGREEKIMIVDIGQSNLCPVRCSSCKNLDSLDAYIVSYLFISNPDKKCPICQKQFKKKTFYENFYLDLELMEFLFQEGHNKEVFYDIKLKAYFHKLNFFTGRSLKQKLRQENKTKKGYIYRGEMDVKLPKQISYVPFIDRRCADNASPEDYNKHLIYVNQNQKLRENTSCPHCKRQVRSNSLEYNEELEQKLKDNNNELRWGALKEQEQLHMNTGIVSIKYYSKIKNEFLINDERKTIKFYWKNYQGTLIRHPFKFRGCTHPLETAICDFTDILYQSKVEKLTKFKCRYKECNKQYTSAEQVEKVSLDIYSKIEENPDLMRKIINNNQYWIEYNLEEAAIVETYNKFDDKNDDKTEQDIIDKYRNKYVENLEEINNRKELHQNLKKINEDIEYAKQRIREDEQEFSLNSTFKHSQNETQFQKLKENLVKMEGKKKRFEQQKAQLGKSEMQENRKSNKTGNINFTKLVKMYQPQVNKLKDKKNEADPEQQAEPVDFSNYKHYGNLYPFIYPVPKTEIPKGFEKDVEKAWLSMPQDSKRVEY